jgi:hypothetical protein
LITLMSPRRWSSGARRVVTIGSRTAWTPGMRRPGRCGPSCIGNTPSSTASCRRGRAGAETLGASLRLPSLVLSTQSLCLGPPCPRQLHFQSARGVTHGTPKRRRRMWRNRSSCTWAFAMGTDWTATTPEFGHEGLYDVGSEEFVVLMFAAPHPPQRAGRMRSAVKALSIARVLATMRVIVSLVSGLPSVWLSRTASSGIFPSTCPRRAELTIPSSIICAGSFAASRATTGSWSDAHRCRMMMAVLPFVSAWTLRQRAMLSLPLHRQDVQHLLCDQNVRRPRPRVAVRGPAGGRRASG